MKIVNQLYTTLVLCLTVMLALSASALAAEPILISEVYAYSFFSTSEFVELYNPTTGAVDISGWTLRTETSTTDVTLPSGSIIPAKGYYLIGDSGWNTGSRDVASWPDADHTQGMTLGSSNGVSDNSGLALVDTTGVVVDAFGWGTASGIPNELYETSPQINGQLFTSYERTLGVDTNNNLNDFTFKTDITPTNSSVSGDVVDQCGNGFIDAGEECEGSNFGGESCTTLGFDDGVLSCNSCQIVTNNCINSPTNLCGNGIIDVLQGEECDGALLGGLSCSSYGFDSGDLSCTSTCELDSSGCFDIPDNNTGGDNSTGDNSTGGDNGGNNGGDNSSTDTPHGVAPEYTSFDGSTTDFDTLNFEQVSSAVLEQTAYGKIVYEDSVLNFSGLDLDTLVTFQNNFVEVDSDTAAVLNAPATITLYGVSLVNPTILRNGQPCGSICSGIFYDGNNIRFTVTGFSTYSAVSGSIDSTEDDGHVNYIRGIASLGSTPLDDGTLYSVTVTSGPYEGYTATGSIGSNVPSHLDNTGSFDTRDDVAFMTGESYSLTVEGCDEPLNGTFSLGGDTVSYSCVVAPTFETFDIDVTNETANVTIASNKPVNLRFEYGTTTDLGRLVLRSEYRNNHSLELLNLEHNTTYYSMTTLCDIDGRCSTTNRTFTTDRTLYPPVWTTIPVLSTDEDVAFTEQIDLYNYSSDELGFDQLHYVVVNQTNTSIVACSIRDNRYLNCTQSEEHVFGESMVTVRATDSDLEYAETNVDVLIHSVNDVPTIDSFELPVATESQEYTLDLDASDVESENLTFTLISPLDAELNSTTGVLNWTPTYSDVPFETFVVEVTDGDGETTNLTFNVTVQSALDFNVVDVSVLHDVVYDNVSVFNITDGSNITLHPLSHVVLDFEVINRLAVDIEDIELFSELSFIPALTNETVRFNLPAGQVKSFSLSMHVDAFVNEDSYALDLFGSGVDIDGATRNVARSYVADLTKLRHDLRLDHSLSSTALSCVRSTQVTTTIQNVGTQIEDDVTLSILVDGTQVASEDFELNVNADTSRTAVVSLPAEGNYVVTSQIVYNNGDLIVTESSDVSVGSCELSFSTQEDVAPPAEFIDLWALVDNASDFDFTLDSQSNGSLISCTLSDDTDTGRTRYIDCGTPSANASGMNVLNVSFISTFSSTQEIAVVVEPVNDAPYATADLPTVNVDEDSSAVSSYVLSDFFSDLENDSITFTVQDGENVAGSVLSNTSVQVVPAADFGGDAELYILASDGVNTSNVTLPVFVQELNDDKPMIERIIPDPLTLPILAEDAIQDFSVVASDPDTESVSCAWYQDDVLRSNSDEFTFIGDNSAGLASFVINVVCDDGNNTDSEQFTIQTSDSPLTMKSGCAFTWDGPITSASNFTITCSEGSIAFDALLNLDDVVDFDSAYRIERGISGINTSFVNELDAPATVTMKNIDSSFLPPLVYNPDFTLTGNDDLCPSSICSNRVFSNGVLTFDVDGFSIFKAETTGVVMDQNIQFGDKNTKASNPEELFEQIISKNVNVVNTQGDTIVIETIAVNPSGTFSASDIQITLTTESLTLVPGEAGIVSLTGRIPEKLDAVNSKLRESSFEVAELTFVGTVGGSAQDNLLGTFNVSMQRQNQLEFNDVDFEFGGQTESVDDGDDIDDIEPGDDVDVEVEVENTYDNDDEVDIDDVEIRLIIDDSDFDVDEDENIGTLDAGDDDTETFDFEVDDDAEDGKSDGTLEVEGKDAYGARHGEILNFDIDIEREDDELTIERADISPSTVGCQRRTALVTVRVRNTGSDDQDEASIQVEAPGLGYLETIDELELDDDESTTKTFGIIIPRDHEGGNVEVTATAMYDGTFADSSVMQLNIVSCTEEKTSVTSTRGGSYDSARYDGGSAVQDSDLVVVASDTAYDPAFIANQGKVTGATVAVPYSTKQMVKPVSTVKVPKKKNLYHPDVEYILLLIILIGVLLFMVLFMLYVKGVVDKRNRRRMKKRKMMRGKRVVHMR